MEEDNQKLSKRDRKRMNRQEKKSSEGAPQMQNKLIVVGAIVAIAIGAFWFMYRGGSGSDQDAGEETQTVAPPSEVTESDHVKANTVEEAPQQVAGEEEQVEVSPNVAVTIVEYGDFQCPACAAYHPIVNQLVEDFPNDLRVVFRHFPLKTIHRHAQIAAQAAEAASLQDKFWEMLDALYDNQDEWVNTRDPRNLFKDYAASLDLDVEKFDSDMNSSEVKAAVDADYESGIKAGIDSTPTFYVNGGKLSSNPQGYEPFSQLVQQIIDQKKSEGEGMMEESTKSSEPVMDDITPSL